MKMISQGVISLIIISDQNVKKLLSVKIFYHLTVCIVDIVRFYNFKQEVLFLKKAYDPFDVVFEEIYNKNYTYLVKYLYLLVYDLNIAEDLAHDIFLRIYKSKNSEITGDKIT